MQGDVNSQALTLQQFTAALSSCTQSINGSYNGTYAKCILVLLLMAVIAIPVGLPLHVVCRPYLKRSNASKANTAGLMHGS